MWISFKESLVKWPWPWPCDLDLDMWPWHVTLNFSKVQRLKWRSWHIPYMPLYSTFLSLFFTLNHDLDLQTSVLFHVYLFFVLFVTDFKRKKISKSVLHETGFSVHQICIKTGVREGNSSFISEINTFQIHLTFKNLENIQEKAYMWKITVIGLKTLFNISERSIAFFCKMMISDQSIMCSFESE